MANVRNLKKDINYVLGDIIEAVYLTELASGGKPSEKSEAIIDEAIVLFDSLIKKVNAKKVEDKKAFVTALASGASDFVTIELSNQVIKVSGNTAWVRHTLNGTNLDGGVSGVVKLHVLLIWQKQNGAWKLLARQAVKILTP